MVCFRNVTKVFLIILIDILWVCLAFPIPRVIPFRRGQSQLASRNLVFGYDALEKVPLINIAATLMSDLAVADDGLARLVSRLGEGGNIRHIQAEHINIRIEDLLEAIERGKEGAPEHVPSILSIRDAVETQLDLLFNDVFDCSVLAFD